MRPFIPLTPRRRTGLIAVGLFALTLAVYWPVRHADFMSVDDQDYVTDNPTVQAGLTWEGARWAFSGTHVANYHPLTWLSHMLDCQLFGLSPAGHHLVNLFIHMLNTILLFLILRRMTGREGCSLFVAALFAVHPQHVESVAWVAERKDVLSGLFWMLSLGAYAWYIEAPSWKRYALLLVTFGLGLLSKPMVVTLPCVLLLMDYWPLKRPVRWTALVVEKLPLFGLAGLGCVATLIAQKSGGAVVSMHHLPLGFRIGNAIVSYVRYLKQFVLPDDLAAFYPLLRPWPMLTVLAAACAIIGISGLVIFHFRRRPYLATGWFWFLGTLVPVIGIVHVGNQAMADRYMYLPMIGLAVAIAWLTAESLQRWPRLIGAAAACVIAACALIAHTDAGYWKNGELLYTRALQRTEPNVFALHNIAAGMVKRGAYADAVVTLEEAVRLQPSNPHIHRLYGYALREAGRLDQAEREIALSLQLDSTYARTWAEMGQIRLAQHRWHEAAEALRRALKLRPEDFDSQINLAVACRMSDDRSGALAALKQACATRPRSPKAWYMTGALLLESDQPAEAIQPLRNAVALKPADADAQFRLGLALMRSGHGADAVEPLMTAVRLSPNSPEPLTRLAWLLATHPDPKLRSGADALMLAARANELTEGTSADALDALAAALAEQHRFDEAADAAMKAAKIAAAKDKATAARMESRASAYRSGQATRDSAFAGADAREALP